MHKNQNRFGNFWYFCCPTKFAIMQSETSVLMVNSHPKSTSTSSQIIEALSSVVFFFLACAFFLKQRRKGMGGEKSEEAK